MEGVGAGTWNEGQMSFSLPPQFLTPLASIFGSGVGDGASQPPESHSVLFPQDGGRGLSAPVFNSGTREEEKPLPAPGSSLLGIQALLVPLLPVLLS